ncbi:MAG: HAD hydrolase-like protein, partial [Bdellovibrionaceae bacterium]|nr:HAD hydrolase-like protein [Pseudobdellovibrionaceae bacterium]
KEHDLALINKALYRKIFDFPVLKYYEQLGFDFKKESFENLCHKFVDRFMSGFQQLPLIPEAKSVLTQLHKEGVSQSVLSATDQPNLDSMIEHFELKDVFKFVYGIDNKLAGSKINRGHSLIQASMIDKSHTVIIGDTLHDLEVAEALGIDAVLISHGHQCYSRLTARHDKVIEAQ